MPCKWPCRGSSQSPVVNALLWSFYVVIGSVKAHYCSHHQGHECDVAHRFSKRPACAHSRNAGSWDSVWWSAGEGAVGREQFNNIKTAFRYKARPAKHCQRFQPSSRHYSLLEWCRQCCRMDRAESSGWWESLVRYVKFQDTEDKGMGLRDDDFMLIIMSEAQIATV